MKIVNPLIKYETLKQACADVDFNIELPSRYRIKDIFVIDGKMLEIRYASLIVRKAKYNRDLVQTNGISGVYFGAYPSDCYTDSFENNDTKGVQYWNGSAKDPKVYLSFWDDKEHKYSYSVYSAKGITLKAMENWQKILK